MPPAPGRRVSVSVSAETELPIEDSAGAPALDRVSSSCSSTAVDQSAGLDWIWVSPERFAAGECVPGSTGIVGCMRLSTLFIISFLPSYEIGPAFQAGR